MGITLDLWRARIGSFGQWSQSSSARVPVRCTRHRLLCVIAFLLLIGCVELNPGPPKVDVQGLQKRIDDLAIEVRATRTEAEQERKAISDQLGLITVEMERKLHNLETALADAVNRIATLERSLVAANATIAQLESGPAASPAGPAATASGTAPLPSMPTNITRLVGELHERANRSKNVVVFGVKIRNNDDDVIKSIIKDELSLHVTAVSCSRLGAGGTRGPAPLLVKFGSDDDALDVIRSAKKLRSSTNADIKASVFIPPDYTKLERKEQYNLRVELRRRKAAGENDLIIRKGSIVTRRQPPAPTGP